MKRALVSAVTAAAIAFGPMAAAPARAADTEDIIGAIIGIAAVAAIANEVKKNRDEKERKEKANRRTVYDDGRYGTFGRRDDWGARNRNSRTKVLPGECLRVLDGSRGDGIVFPERCLKRNGIGSNSLPSRCESRVRTRDGRLDVYDARCLAGYGWTLPRIAARR